MIKSNCQVPNSFFGIPVNFIIQKLSLMGHGMLIALAGYNQKEASLKNSNFSIIQTVSPKPLPTKVEMSLNIYDIVGVNEAQQTVTLMLRVDLMWQDFLLNVTRSDEDLER